MRTATEGVTDTLITNAKKEFLKYGFRDASLRRISSDSNVSTNSIYTRFKDKEGLFEAVVKPYADELLQIFLGCVFEASGCSDITEANFIGDNGTEQVLSYIYKHQDIFKLIFCCSFGTKYENYLDKLAEIEEGYYKHFFKKYGAPNINVSDFFIHVLCTTGWNYIYEVISHDLNYEEAKEFMDNIRRFSFGGFKELLDT